MSTGSLARRHSYGCSNQWLAPRQKIHRLASAMRSLLVGEASAEPELPPSALFALETLAEECKKPKRDRPQPDVVLDKQMSLFDVQR